MNNEEIQVAIVSSNYIHCCGLKHVLSDFFQADDVDVYADFQTFERSSVGYDCIFMDALIFIANIDVCKERKKYVLLSEKSSSVFSYSELALLDLTLDKASLLDALSTIWINIQPLKYEEQNKDLSEREREVLELVVKGYTSKEIAGMLSISSYTVQAHRKNISAKLGIKSVSALTVYAMMNGILSVETK